MSKIFRQHSAVSCFYCQSTISPIPRNPRSFRCPHCDCWNRYDATGEIVSDEPAMHDENMNTRSFARRASPRKDRLPTMYGSTLFCHTCQTNQMLIANLLSNYLPAPDDPEYESRVETLPEYRHSVEVRYPPVCSVCAPAVEEEIRRRDHMARTRALGGFLNAARGKGGSRSAEATAARHGREKLAREIAVWKVRGCLWFGGLACVLAGYIAVVCQYSLPRPPAVFQLVLPFVALVSILWTAWDPTYASLRRAQFQGRTVRQRGKKEYNILQMVAWLSRFSTTIVLAMPRVRPSWNHVHLWDDPHSCYARIYCSVSLALELLILIRSGFVLQLQRPPAVRLMDTTTHKQPLTAPSSSLPTSRSATPAEPDLFAALTLSSKPVMHAPAPSSNPIFGLPSLAGPPPSSPPPRTQLNAALSPNGMDVEDDSPVHEHDPNAMDWSPIPPAKTRPSASMQNGHPTSSAREDDGAWLRPQRFFAPEEPTGLENLFARTIRLVDDEHAGAASGSVSGHAHGRRRWRKPVWMGAALCVLLALPLAYRAWQSKRAIVHVEI
ncbi:Ima1 N-terminal domain-containing protein [Amylocystis lapponica]|nr:Ima1 N-terminal domain-containing protein [Amylocystis lapponica]